MPPALPRYSGRNTLALDRLRRIARRLGPLTERVVFIGGAVAPLLQTEDSLPRIRPTTDVDAVIATSSYAELEPLSDALRARGFSLATHAPEHGATTHMHRWLAPDGGGPFDLVPIGSHAGGTGAGADVYAVASAVLADLREHDEAPPCVVRHASPVAFLMLKWAAHTDRGSDNPFDSHDLEDIVALIASRPSVAIECRSAPTHVRHLLAEHARAFLRDADLADELISALLPAGIAHHVRDVTRERIERISALDGV